MGNKASILFGGGTLNDISDTEEAAPLGCARGSKSTRPVALSAQEQAVADAEAKQYSELFGGKPKVKASVAGGERRSARKPAPSKKKTAAASHQQQQKKKKQRSDPGLDLHARSAKGGGGGNNSNTTDGVTAEGGGGGGDSAPASPYRGKASWMGGKPARVGGGGEAEGGKECVAETSQQQQQQDLVKAVSAKITDLEKEKGKTDTGNGEERREGEKTDEGTAQTVAAFYGDGGYDRAAVANALFAGVEPSAISSKEVMLALGINGGGLGGVMQGEASVAAAMPVARSTSPRPAPQRNFKLKN
ncbi:unnamed protein product [Pylaiella littoralis]